MIAVFLLLLGCSLHYTADNWSVYWV